MALLGKTLKGRTTRQGGNVVQRNIRQRKIAKTQEEFDQFQKLAKEKKLYLKNKFMEEQKVYSFNKRKLLTQWRQIMRKAKTEELKNEIDIHSQNHQRELDSKEAFLQMLDKNLDEAEDQYQIALRNHLIHLDYLMDLQDSRLKSLQEEFERDVSILENEFEKEREELIKSFNKKLQELDDMMETIKEEEKKKSEEAKNEHQALREEIRTKISEDNNTMKTQLDSRQSQYINDLESQHQKYVSETQKNTEQHGSFFDQNKQNAKLIDKNMRNIATKKAKIDLMRIKIFQHRKECQSRNISLKKEKENIARNYQELKNKMLKFREDESKRLVELVNNSRNTVLKLKEYQDLGEKILKTAELCRRLETEKEKVLPFYESTFDESEIPEELQNAFQEISKDQYKEFKYLNNFFKRFNKVMLDKLAIEKQKETLQKDNNLLKSLLKQYLDGISLNDDVIKSNNPLLVINNKINISRPPVEKLENKTVIEGAVVVKNNTMQLNRQ